MTANRFRFRAWDAHYRKWLDDFHVTADGKIMNEDLDESSDGAVSYYFSEPWQIKEITLMQSTGLCDKNGKEVFEGDILEAEPGRLINPLVYRDDVRWDQEAAAFTFTWSPHTAKIIGNIYEHPELLQLEDKIIFESGASITLTGKK